LLLIHQPALWGILDEWLSGLEELAFTEALPMLRRTFSGFSKAERRKMLGMAANPDLAVSIQAVGRTSDLSVPKSDAVRLLLGLS